MNLFKYIYSRRSSKLLKRSVGELTQSLNELFFEKCPGYLQPEKYAKKEKSLVSCPTRS